MRALPCVWVAEMPLLGHSPVSLYFLHAMLLYSCPFQTPPYPPPLCLKAADPRWRHAPTRNPVRMLVRRLIEEATKQAPPAPVTPDTSESALLPARSESPRPEITRALDFDEADAAETARLAAAITAGSVSAALLAAQQREEDEARQAAGAFCWVDLVNLPCKWNELCGNAVMPMR